MFHPITDPKTGRERLPTVHEALQQLEARSKAKAIAKQAAEHRERERREAAPPQPVNAAAIILDRMHTLPPRVREQLQREAAQREREIANQAAEQARKAAIEADPAVINAREDAGYLIKTAGEEFMAEAAECAALAEFGDDVPLYLSKARELQRKIWERDDRVAAEKLIASGQASAAFNEAAQRALEAEKRLRAANANVSE